MRALAFGALALAGCAAAPVPIDLNTPAIQSLMAQPLPEYAAKMRVARQIALSCDQLAFNERVVAAISAARPDTSQGRLEAIRQQAGISLATDVELRSFLAKHNVSVDAENLCAAGAQEMNEQTAISAFLQRR